MKRRSHTYAENLNLIPFIDMFVTLIAFMLMTAVLEAMGGIQVETPSLAQNKNLSDTHKQTIQFLFELNAKQISVRAFANDLQDEIPSLKKNFSIKNLTSLERWLDQQKIKFPQMGPSLFHADGNLPYEQVALVLDSVKKTPAGKNVVLALGVNP